MRTQGETGVSRGPVGSLTPLPSSSSRQRPIAAHTAVFFPEPHSSCSWKACSMRDPGAFPPCPRRSSMAEPRAQGQEQAPAHAVGSQPLAGHMSTVIASSPIFHYRISKLNRRYCRLGSPSSAVRSSELFPRQRGVLRHRHAHPSPEQAPDGRDTVLIVDQDSPFRIICTCPDCSSEIQASTSGSPGKNSGLRQAWVTKGTAPLHVFCSVENAR